MRLRTIALYRFDEYVPYVFYADFRKLMAQYSTVVEGFDFIMVIHHY